MYLYGNFETLFFFITIKRLFLVPRKRQNKKKILMCFHRSIIINYLQTRTIFWWIPNSDRYWLNDIIQLVCPIHSYTPAFYSNSVYNENAWLCPRDTSIYLDSEKNFHPRVSICSFFLFSSLLRLFFIHGNYC